MYFIHVCSQITRFWRSFTVTMVTRLCWQQCTPYIEIVSQCYFYQNWPSMLVSVSARVTTVNWNDPWSSNSIDMCNLECIQFLKWSDWTIWCDVNQWDQNGKAYCCWILKSVNEYAHRMNVEHKDGTQFDKEGFTSFIKFSFIWLNFLSVVITLYNTCVFSMQEMFRGYNG